MTEIPAYIKDIRIKILNNGCLMLSSQVPTQAFERVLIFIVQWEIMANQHF